VASTGAGCAHGKAILIGEHLVLEGATALALPVPSLSVQVDVRVAPGQGSQVVVEPDDEMSLDIGVARAMLDDAMEAVGWPTAFAATAQVRGTLPIGRGLGSSAAFALATLRALAAASELTMSLSDLVDAARALEGHAHGRSSGLDPAACALDAPVLFRGARDWRPVSTGAELNFVLVDAGAGLGTRAAIGRAAAVRQDLGVSALRELVDDVSEMALAGAGALERGDAAELGRVLDEAGAVLARLQVVTDHAHALCGALRRAGAHGAKVTGAGCGGYVIAAAPLDAVHRLLETARRVGAPAHAFTVSASGGRQ